MTLFIIHSSNTGKDITSQSFYPLAVYARADDITTSIWVTLGIANHEPNKIIRIIVI